MKREKTEKTTKSGEEKAMHRNIQFGPRVHSRILTNNAWSRHFIDHAVLVRYVPVTVDEFDGKIRIVADDDAVSPDIAIVLRIGLLLQVERLDNYFYIACEGPVHALHLSRDILLVSYTALAPSRNAAASSAKYRRLHAVLIVNPNIQS